MKIQATILFSSLVIMAMAATASEHHHGGTPTLEYLAGHAHFLDIPRSPGARMFYFFFESMRKPKEDPVVVWLSGGPGVGSEVAVFYINGPVHLSDNGSLSWNDFGWNKAANVLYIDNPLGSGFSSIPDEDDICTDQECVSADLFDFIQAFFRKHKSLVTNPFFITGESFAGHYIPPFAARIHHLNKAGVGIKINLKGFAIGNGITNPSIQYTAFPDYALQMGSINLTDYERITKDLLLPCLQTISLCDSYGGQVCNTSYIACHEMYYGIIAVDKDMNDHDLRKKCYKDPCTTFPVMEKFLNETWVRQALGAGTRGFSWINNKVYNAMACDRMRSYQAGIPDLLDDGVKVLINAGVQDFSCNWIGNWRWVHAMEWSGRKKFAASRTVRFSVAGKAAGELTSYGTLAFLKIYEAGHMAPMDQPEAALEMIMRFMSGNLN